MHKIIIIFRWILLSRVCFLDQLKNSNMKLSIRFGVNIQLSIVIIVLLTVMDLFGTVKIFLMVIVSYGIKNTIFSIHQSYWLCRFYGNFKNNWDSICRAFMGLCNRIKSRNISALGSDISEKRSDVHTSAYI